MHPAFQFFTDSTGKLYQWRTCPVQDGPHWCRVDDMDPYVQEADANPERADNSCMIYKDAA